MAEANVFFLYDVDTEELLGFTVFEGTFKGASISDDSRSIVMKVDNYRHFPFDGSIVPTIKDGGIHVGIYEILKSRSSTAVDVEVIPLPCGPHPKYFAELMIPRFAEQARLEVKKRRDEAEKRERQLLNQLIRLAPIVIASAPNKWSS
jgi:hypothetical protein